jgi:2-polyprenyl-6-methoxyphenol hydroxylase-like FAD-dependent oxidoreductase
LAKENIDVTLLDMGPSLDQRPRATHYSPPASLELEKAGILEDVWKRGFIPGGIEWRKLDLTPIAAVPGLPEELRTPDKGLLCLPLNFLGQVMMEHLAKYPSAKILWSHEVVGIEEGQNQATVIAKTAEGEKRYSGDYIIGCDGANSKIRRSLFGDWNFPGFTWAEQIVATNVSSSQILGQGYGLIQVYYDFPQHGVVDGQFVVHPEHWHMVARISNDGLYRVSYGELTGLSHDEVPSRFSVLMKLIARQPMKYEVMLPGHPKPGDYKLTNCMPYKIHQRCAEKFKVGRFLIAADAAHLCNPFGGMGLTGGLVDTGNLADCLIGIEKGLTDDTILERWDEVRREKWHNIINPVSSANIRRLNTLDPDTAVDNDDFFKLLKKAEKDPSLLKSMGDVFPVICTD